MTDIKAAKAQARKAAFSARKAAREASPNADRLASEHGLEELRRLKLASVISAYLPIRTEIDPLPLMNELHNRGHKLCVPVVEGAERPLLFREWAPDAQLIRGTFDVEIPATGAWVEPQVLIVPMLAFDRECYRLGYGGGFYDRTIAGLRQRAEVRAIGFAYAGQLMESIPREATDMQLDAIITEAGLLRPAK